MNAAPALPFLPGCSEVSREVSSPGEAEQSPPNSSGQMSGQGMACDPLRLRAVMPERWQAFLHAHFQSVQHVAFTFGVTEKAAAKWWEGIGGPQGDKVVLAAIICPAGFDQLVSGAA